MKKLILPLLLFMAVFSSCDSGKIYEKHLDNERITWNRFDVKTFRVDIEDISSAYDFYIAIRHLTNVPLKFITVKSTIYTPSGETRMMEHKIMLKNDEGKLLGEGMGELWDVVYLAREDLQFSESGTFVVEISSTMMQTNLPGIMQVGLIVKKSG